MSKRIRWMIYGVVLFGLGAVYVLADFRSSPLRPDPAVIELAKAKGYIEAAVSKRPPVKLVEGAEPIVYFRFSGEFEEPATPVVEIAEGWTFGETVLAGEPTICPEPPPRPTGPSWYLRSGDLRGDCSCDMVRTGDVVLGKVAQLVEAQTPHGLISRQMAPTEEQVELWASPAVLPGRWRVLFDLDMLVPLDSNRPTLGFLGATWFKPQRRIGWRVMGGRSFGGGVSDTVSVDFSDDDEGFEIDIPFSTSEDGWYVGGGAVIRLGKK